MADSRPSNKKIHKYAVYRTVMLVLGVMLVTSVVFQGITDMSLLRWFAGGCSILSAILSFFQPLISADAVLKSAETIGFCSILIAWIYAALDKTDFGFRYGDLLEELYPRYHWLVLEHLLAILACVWLAKLSMLTNAMLALLVVLMGCWLQWYALKNIVLSTEERRRVAVDRWNRLNKEALVQNGADGLIGNLYDMAAVISLGTSDSCTKIQKAFSEALLLWVQNGWSYNLLERRNLLIDITKIWDTLLCARPENEQRFLVRSILKNCRNSAYLNVVSTGFALWVYQYHLKRCAGDPNLSQEDILDIIAARLSALEVRDFFQQETNITFYWNAVFTMIVWMHFLYGNVGLRSSLFSLCPEEVPAESRDEGVFYAAIQSVFSQEDWEEFFYRAYRQVFGT